MYVICETVARQHQPFEKRAVAAGTNCHTVALRMIELARKFMAENPGSSIYLNPGLVTVTLADGYNAWTLAEVETV